MLSTLVLFVNATCQAKTDSKIIREVYNNSILKFTFEKHYNKNFTFLDVVLKTPQKVGMYYIQEYIHNERLLFLIFFINLVRMFDWVS